MSNELSSIFWKQITKQQGIMWVFAKWSWLMNCVLWIENRRHQVVIQDLYQEYRSFISIVATFTIKLNKLELYVSQITKDTSILQKWLSPLIFFGPGLSSFKHILRWYTTTGEKFRLCRFVQTRRTQGDSYIPPKHPYN